MPDGFQIEDSGDAFEVSNSPKRKEYLNDSVNPSLKKKCLKGFVACEEFKGSFPADGDLSDVAYHILLEDGPIFTKLTVLAYSELSQKFIVLSLHA